MPTTDNDHARAQRKAWKSERRDLERRMRLVAKDARADLRAIMKAARDLRRRLAAETTALTRRAAILDGRINSPS
jgi:hypothetical protein